MPIANPKRGCGSKKAGGFYLESGTGKNGGSLSLLTSWFGKHYGESTTIIDMSPLKHRGQQLFAPAATIEQLTMQEFGSVTPLSLRITKDGNDNALADHVGTDNYTVWGFMIEALEHGISRRINKHNAAAIAKSLPMPIVFIQSLPYWGDDHLYKELWGAVEAWDSQSYMWTHDTAVWETEEVNWDGEMSEWGTFANMYNGDRHRMNAIMRYYDYCHSKDIIEGLRLFAQATWFRAPFASSWVTTVNYVIKEGDSVAKLLDIADNNINVDYLEGVS